MITSTLLLKRVIPCCRLSFLFLNGQEGGLIVSFILQVPFLVAVIHPLHLGTGLPSVHRVRMSSRPLACSCNHRV